MRTGLSLVFPIIRWVFYGVLMRACPWPVGVLLAPIDHSCSIALSGHSFALSAMKTTRRSKSSRTTSHPQRSKHLRGNMQLSSNDTTARPTCVERLARALTLRATAIAFFYMAIPEEGYSVLQDLKDYSATRDPNSPQAWYQQTIKGGEEEYNKSI